MNSATTKNLFMSIEQNSGQNHNTKQGNVSFDMCKIKTPNNDINKLKYYV